MRTANGQGRVSRWHNLARSREFIRSINIKFRPDSPARAVALFVESQHRVIHGNYTELYDVHKTTLILIGKRFLLMEMFSK